ncbi:MAG: ATP-binding protein [Firmicutes bacterium]|nr:ATP-binding protein [Bacillota bacterium]
MTDDLLELARIEGDGLRLAPHRLQAGEALARAVESLLPVAAQRSVRMELKRDRRDPDDIRADHAIQADPDRLQQVLVNILSNAIRFSPEGGVVRASVSREGVMVRITVEDEGPGIPPEQLPRIFDRFYKADRSRSQKESADSFALGSGLGLTIARHLVEAMRGGIMAESRVGDGTRIIIDLPYAG